MEALLAGLLYVLWRGIAIGVMISAPMGPVGMLCIQRTLSKGRLTGLYTGIGAAASDLIYCLLTGFGLSFIEDFLTRNQNVIQLLGSGVLIGFAIYLLRKNPVTSLRTRGEPDSSTPHKDILGGFLFTFSNPLILFLIVGLFARFNFLDAGLRWYIYILGYISIAAGALGWWWMVTYFVNKVRAHFNVRSLWLINRVIGVVILIFGIVGLVTGISAMASAAEIISCSNPSRGYAPWGYDITDTALTLADENEAQFRLSETDSSPSSPMSLTWCGSAQGKKGWELRVQGDNDTLTLHFHTTEADRRDPLGSRPHLEVDITDMQGNIIARRLFDKVDTDKGINRFRLKREGMAWSLRAGNRPGGNTLDFHYAIDITSLSFAPLEDTRLDIRDIELITHSDPRSGFYAEPDSLAERVRRAGEAGDLLAGEWQVYDRTLEESLLRIGGDYRLYILPDTEGWTGYYASGAGVCPDSWTPGRVKMRIHTTSFPDHYATEWHDAMGLPMTHDIIATLDDEEMVLTIRFPYQQSELRLKRLSPLPD